MFQSIMSLFISVVCLFGGLFMFLFCVSHIGTPYFMLGPTLLGLVLAVINVFELYLRFAKKDNQDARKKSTPTTQASPSQKPATTASSTQAMPILPAESFSTVQRVLSTMNQEAVEAAFYGGKANAEAIVAELIPVLAPEESADDTQVIDEAIKFYIDVWIRKRGGLSPEFMTTGYIKSALTNKYQHRGAEAVSAAVDRSVAFIYQHEPEIQQRDEMLQFQQELVLSKAGQNADAEAAHLDDADYGLVPEKPVFVAGFPGTHAYLDSLCLSDGTQPTFNRTGSVNVQGIEGPVDAYEVIAGGKAVGHIFLCLYGRANSARAPKGFVLR